MTNNNFPPDKVKSSLFEEYKKINFDGLDYWSARDLFKILDYQKWDKFKNVIERAKESCKNSNQNPDDHFPRVEKLVTPT
jgi:DNA-damage-inducible protein D